MSAVHHISADWLTIDTLENIVFSDTKLALSESAWRRALAAGPPRDHECAKRPLRWNGAVRLPDPLARDRVVHGGLEDGPDLVEQPGPDQGAAGRERVRRAGRGSAGVADRHDRRASRQGPPPAGRDRG